MTRMVIMRRLRRTRELDAGVHRMRAINPSDGSDMGLARLAEQM